MIALSRLQSKLALVATSLLLFSALATDESNTAHHPTRRRTLYQRSSYPEYCSTPTAMERRRIPPIQRTTADEGGDGVQTQLLQVSAVIRHGARTPWRPLTCWRDYATVSRGYGWDCSLKSLMAPARHPGPSRSPPPHDGADYDGGATLLFEKRYDALKPPRHNYLNGTCLLGQLIEQGYDMELVNGRHIRDAYVGTSDASMRLFESTNYRERPYPESTRFRVDDEQRTLMSGQILIGGIFDVDRDTVMPLHTADYRLDVFSPYGMENNCPRLAELRIEAQASTGFKSGTSSGSARDLMHLATNDLKPHEASKAEEEMIDCLMTTYCTDRPLPHILDDFEADGDGSIFSRLFNYSVWEQTYHFSHDDAAYSKLAMGPLWSEIHRPLSKTRGASNLDDMEQRKLPRLLLYSGHDTTLHMLLASLGAWDRTWAPYASMVLIESHAITSGPHPDFPSGHAFRLLYNGAVITHRVGDCNSNSELCDLDVLLDRIMPLLFGQDGDGCKSKSTASTTPSSEAAQTDGSSRRGGVGVPMILFLLSMASVLSSAATFAYVTGRFPLCRWAGHVVFPPVQGRYDRIGAMKRKSSLDSSYSASANGYFDTAVEGVSFGGRQDQPSTEKRGSFYGAADDRDVERSKSDVEK